MTTPAHKWGTDCKLWVNYEPGAQAADIGDYIVSNGGSAYLVLEARRMTRSARPNRWLFKVRRADPDSIPEGADVFGVRWYKR